MLEIVVELVLPERAAEIERPAADVGAEAGDTREVVHARMELRQEALRIQLWPVPVAVGIAPKAVPRPFAVAVAAKRVQLTRPGRIERHPEVRERHPVLLEPVAPVVIGLRERIALHEDVTRVRIDRVCDAVRVHQE